MEEQRIAITLRELDKIGRCIRNEAARYKYRMQKYGHSEKYQQEIDSLFKLRRDLGERWQQEMSAQDRLDKLLNDKWH